MPNFLQVKVVVSGPNAIRALKGLGILDVILAKSKIREPSMDLFRFVTGSGDHELVFDVGAEFCRGEHHSD